MKTIRIGNVTREFANKVTLWLTASLKQSYHCIRTYPSNTFNPLVMSIDCLDEHCDIIRDGVVGILSGNDPEPIEHHRPIDFSKVLRSFSSPALTSKFLSAILAASRETVLRIEHKL